MPTSKTDTTEGQPAPLDIKFVINPDELGLGRIIVNGRYYGLPLAAVLEFQRLRDEQISRVPNENYYKNLALIAESLEGMPAHLADRAFSR